MKKVRKHSKKQNMATYIWEGVAVISVCIMLMLLPGILEYHRDVRLSKRALELEERTKADRYCELTVPDSDINFPVLRCEDNQKYLHTTYTGEENELGGIFLDYRCDLEDNPHNIIYGHDAQDVDGTRLMFGTLRNYLDEEFICIWRHQTDSFALPNGHGAGLPDNHDRMTLCRERLFT